MTLQLRRSRDTKFKEGTIAASINEAGVADNPAAALLM